MNPLFGFIEGIFQPMHLLIIGVIAILVFGKRLPEVGRSLGKGIVEFKKGLKGLEDELETPNANAPRQDVAALQPPPRPPQRIAPSVPKFEDNAGTITTPPQG